MVWFLIMACWQARNEYKTILILEYFLCRIFHPSYYSLFVMYRFFALRAFHRYIGLGGKYRVETPNLSTFNGHTVRHGWSCHATKISTVRQIRVDGAQFIWLDEKSMKEQELTYQHVCRKKSASLATLSTELFLQIRTFSICSLDLNMVHVSTYITSWYKIYVLWW